ncbi:MAG: (2Fe-2S)-binding protein [Fervidicoccaceae archaeon]
MKVSFKLNGNPVEVEVPPNEILLDTLRLRLGVKGPKRGCERAECGTCTVLLDGKPVYSCNILTVQVDGSSVQTIEGIANDELGRRLAESFSKEGAVQCGFCTPGFVATSYALVKSLHEVSDEQIKKYIEGNLCRCTGYKKIVDAIKNVISSQRK